MAEENGYRDFVGEATKRRIEAERALAESGSAINVGSLIQGGINLATKRKELKDFGRGINREQQGIYNKVGSFDNIETVYDKKSEQFFYDLISDYNEIKNHIDNGTMVDTELGKKDLAAIKNLVDNYSDAMPKILATSQAITQASKIPVGEAGSLSVAGAPIAQLDIIRKITAGGKDAEDIDFLRDGSNIILFDNSTGQKLNIAEFSRSITNKENPYLKFVPDISEALTSGYDLFVKDNKGEYQDTYTTLEHPNPNASQEEIEKYKANPTAIRYMSEENEEKLKSDLMGQFLVNEKGEITKMRNGGIFRKLIETNGESIWEDMMPLNKDHLVYPPASDIPLPGDKDYEGYYKTYYKPMLEWLSSKTINENTKDLRRQTVQNKLATQPKNQNFTKSTADDITPESQTKIDNAKPGEIITIEYTNGAKAQIRKRPEGA